MSALQGNLQCDFLASRSTFRGSGTSGDGARHWFGLGKMGPPFSTSPSHRPHPLAQASVTATRKGASSNPGSLFYARQSIVTASSAGDSGGGQSGAADREIAIDQCTDTSRTRKSQAWPLVRPTRRVVTSNEILEARSMSRFGNAIEKFRGAIYSKKSLFTCAESKIGRASILP